MLGCLTLFVAPSSSSSPFLSFNFNRLSHFHPSISLPSTTGTLISLLSLLRIYLLCICLAFTFLPSNLYLPVKFPSIHMNIHTIFGLYVYLLCPSPCVRALLNSKFHFHVKIERFLDFICSNFTSAFFKFLFFEILKIGLGICINFNVV